MSPSASSSTTQVATDRESVDDLESKIVEAKTNIRGFLDELPSIRKELDARYVVELQFHIKVIEQSIEKIRKIRQQCALEQKQNTTASTCSTAGSTCSARGTPVIVTPPREPGNSNSGNEAAFVENSGSSTSSHQIRHILAGTFTCSPSASKSSKNATTRTRSSGERAEAVEKQKQNKAAGRTATRSSPRRKVIKTKESDDHRQELLTAAEPSAQSTGATSSPQGRRTSSRKHVPTSIFESPEIPKANRKNNGNKSSRITMRLRTVTAGAIDGFVMEDEVLYPVKIKERDGRMLTVAWRGGYSGTLKVRKGQIVPANSKTIAEWNKIVAEANDIREKLIKDREEKEARKRKKRQEELEVKRAKKARKEKMMELEKERKIKEDRAKMRKKYGPPLDANLTSVPTAREEGDVKMEGSRIIYYAHEDDTPECIAKRFSVPVARVIYDNQSHVNNIAAKSALKAFTPIILPQT